MNLTSASRQKLVPGVKGGKELSRKDASVVRYREAVLLVQPPTAIGSLYRNGVNLQRDLAELLLIPKLGGLLRQILRKFLTRLPWPAGEMGVVLLRDDRTDLPSVY